MNPVRVRLLGFGPVGEALNAAELAFELPSGATVATLFTAAESRCPQLQEFRGKVAFARNAVWCTDAVVLANGDEVALIPPVSGG